MKAICRAPEVLSHKPVYQGCQDHISSPVNVNIYHSVLITALAYWNHLN